MRVTTRSSSELLRSRPGRGTWATGSRATCVEIKILRRLRAESSRRPPRHRRDALLDGVAMTGSSYEKPPLDRAPDPSTG